MKKLLAIPLMALALQGCWQTEAGEKVGTIVKFTKKGAFIGTYEAELIRGGMNNGSGSFGKSFDFTIDKTDLMQIVQDAVANQFEVRIRYHKEWFVAPWRSDDNNYFLDAIEILK